MAQYRGRVMWFNNAKGYGFLGSERQPDVFCRFSSIQSEGYKNLSEGEEWISTSFRAKKAVRKQIVL